MKTAYYARPISIDGTPQFDRDIKLIEMIGFVPTPSPEDKIEILKQYKIVGMEAFRESVETSDILIFRAFPDGSIGTGVYKEIKWALDKNIPIIEIPRQIERRKLSVDDTRSMLEELGNR